MPRSILTDFQMKNPVQWPEVYPSLHGATELVNAGMGQPAPLQMQAPQEPDGQSFYEAPDEGSQDHDEVQGEEGEEEDDSLYLSLRK